MITGNRFKNFILEIGNGKDISPDNYEDYNDSDIIYPSVNNFTKGVFKYKNLTFISEKYGLPKILEDDDIVITRSGTVGTTYVWNNDKINQFFGRKIIAIPSGYLIVVKVDKTKILPLFIQHYFNSKIVQGYFNVFGVGKTQKNIAQPDILNIIIPNIPIATQQQILQQIQPIEAEITALQAQICEPLAIINEVFAVYYGYDADLWRAFGKGMTAGTQKSATKTAQIYTLDFADIGSSHLVRMSCRYHNPLTQQLTAALRSKAIRKVKSVLNALNKGIQPVYDTEGQIPVAKIATLKNGYIDFSDPEFVNQDFYNNANELAKLKYGDVLICATGKISLGKIDFYNLEEDSIISVDNYILKVNTDIYNPLFLTYFLRSILGAFQVERDYTGTTNQIHLYAAEISNFEIPDIPLDAQTMLVAQIKQGLDAQTHIESEIANKQNEISRIIESAIV